MEDSVGPALRLTRPEGAKGGNLWTLRAAPRNELRGHGPVVEKGWRVRSGAMLPTEERPLHVSATATDGVSIADAKSKWRLLGFAGENRDYAGELKRAKGQCQAQLVFEEDSITTSGHRSATSRPSADDTLRKPDPRDPDRRR